jgi:hypothetical protein
MQKTNQTKEKIWELYILAKSKNKYKGPEVRNGLAGMKNRKSKSLL